MRHIDLPAPVLALIDAGRRVVASPRAHSHADVGASAETRREYALRHGMLAWAADGIPDQSVLAHTARALQGVRQLLALLDRFTVGALPVVALKGPAFSQWLYGDAAARRFSDLDLLVPRERRDSARALLEQMGFERRIPAAPGDVVYASIGAWPMVHASQLPVDLHWTLAGRRFPRALDAGDVLRESIDVVIGGRSIRVPRPEHAAVLTLMHSAKHLWYALELPFSIAVLACRADVDWHAVRDLSARAGALRAAAAGLALAADLFAVEVPAPFRRDLALTDVRSLSRYALRTLALPPGVFADWRLERTMQVLSFDRRRDRLLYDIRRLTEPTRAEWEWVAMPPALAGLYWPARLIRVASIAISSPSRHWRATP
jgi:Uncharacterised nucleotidyltransferase